MASPNSTTCAHLGIDRLELRRLRADLIFCYKIIHGLVLLSSYDFLPRFVIVLLVGIVLNCFYRTIVLIVDNISLQFVLSQFGIHYLMLFQPTH